MEFGYNISNSTDNAYLGYASAVSTSQTIFGSFNNTSGGYNIGIISDIANNNIGYQEPDRSPAYRKNKQLLLSVIMKHCGIKEEDINDEGIVKSKIRDFKLENIFNKLN